MHELYGQPVPVASTNSQAGCTSERFPINVFNVQIIYIDIVQASDTECIVSSPTVSAIEMRMDTAGTTEVVSSGSVTELI
jgi:hypothetical protein